MVELETHNDHNEFGKLFWKHPLPQSCSSFEENAVVTLVIDSTSSSCILRKPCLTRYPRSYDRHELEVLVGGRPHPA